MILCYPVTINVVHCNKEFNMMGLERVSEHTKFLMVQCNMCKCCWGLSDGERKLAYDYRENAYKFVCPGCGKCLTVTRTLGP